MNKTQPKEKLRGATGQKALVAFGTKYGTTAKVATKIAEVLRGNGIDASVVDLRKPDEVVTDGYDLVVVGSSIIMGKWSKGALDFLERNKEAWSRKRVAMFVCSGNVYTDPDKIETYRKAYLDDIQSKFGISDRAQKGLFGGEIDFSQYGFLTKALVNSAWRDALKGVDLSKPFDFRDWDAIEKWAASLATEGAQ